MKKLVHVGMICAAAALAVSASSAQAQRRGAVTSAYTELDLDRCTQLSSNPDEAGSAEWRCPGYRGIPLLVAEGDLRFDIDAGARNANFETASMFNTPGSRVEWRLRGGRPFAIIYRLRLSSGDGQPERTLLVVKTIGRAGRPGCPIAWISGSAPEPNVQARQQADLHAAGFRCGRDRSARIGEVDDQVPFED